MLSIISLIDFINLKTINLFFLCRFEAENEVPKVLTQLATRFTSQKQIDKVRIFVEDNKSQLGSTQLLSLALKNAEDNLKWAEQNIPLIKKSLGYNPSAGSTIIISFISFMLPILVIVFY